MTIADLGADNAIDTGDDKGLFSKEYTTGKNGWAVYDSTTEPAITALGNRVRFAFSAVHATGEEALIRPKEISWMQRNSVSGF